MHLLLSFWLLLRIIVFLPNDETMTCNTVVGCALHMCCPSDESGKLEVFDTKLASSACDLLKQTATETKIVY